MPNPTAVVDEEPLAFQPSFPGMGPTPCALGQHRFVGRGRWRSCVSCWWAGWFPKRRR